MTSMFQFAENTYETKAPSSSSKSHEQHDRSRPQASAKPNYHRRPSRSQCQDVFALYHRCSTNNNGAEGFSCGGAVKAYMSCAMSSCEQQQGKC